MRPQPYIGVTGITSHAQANALMSVVKKEHNVLIMLGMLVSNKTLHGEPNKWPKRYPNIEKLSTIFPDHSKALNLIHFNSKMQGCLLDDMLLAQEMAGPHCHGFQLNIAWPDKKMIELYKMHRAFVRKRVVLQCGGGAMGEMDWKPEKIAQRVREYQGLVDYVLIDPSGGLGKDFDGEFAYECFSELSVAVPDVGLVIAGGLHKGNVVSKLPPLLIDHVLSWDAEGKLRTSEDDLDIKASQDYVTASISLSRYVRALNEKSHCM